MSNYILHRLQIKFGCFLLIFGLFSYQSTLAVYNDDTFDPTFFYDSINFEPYYRKILPNSWLRGTVSEIFTKFLLIQNRVGGHETIKKSQMSELVTNIIFIMKNVEAKNEGDNKKLFSIVARNVFSIGNLGNQNYNFDTLNDVKYRGVSIGIWNPETVSDSEPTFYGFINMFANAYFLPGALSELHRVFEANANEPTGRYLPQVPIDVTGPGLKNDPFTILSLFSEKLDWYFKHAGGVIRYADADEKMIQIAKSFGIPLYHNDFNDRSFTTQDGTPSSFADFKDAVRDPFSKNLHAGSGLPACNEALRLSLVNSGSQPEMSDSFTSFSFLNSRTLRFASRRCGVEIILLENLKPIPTREEISFALGHNEFLFKVSGCESILEKPLFGDPKAEKCTRLVITGVALQKLLEQQNVESLDHPKTWFASLFKNFTGQERQACTMIELPVVHVFSTAFEGAFTYTILNSISQDFRLSESKPNKIVGCVIGYALVSVTYIVTYTSIASIAHSGYLAHAIFIFVGLSLRLLINHMELHVCEYCQKKESDEVQEACININDINNKNDEAPLNQRERSWLQRFARAAAHDLPEVKKFIKFPAGTLLCSAITSAAIFSAKCYTLEKTVLAYFLTVSGSVVGAAVANNGYRGVKVLASGTKEKINRCVGYQVGMLDKFFKTIVVRKH